MPKHKRPTPRRVWTPFVKMDKVPFEGGIAYENSIYVVIVAEWQGQMWLRIRKQNMEPVRDWRDLQRIKNELAGPEREAVQVFPAESRLADTSNNYHLWVLPEGEKYPTPYNERTVFTRAQLEAEAKKQGVRGRDWAKQRNPRD
ncbi:MAG: hypothetical protein M3P43_12015 [Actinomycetota bacterium]|nr:hypothetical protein [Actinomycetota bacterium]